MGEDDDDWLFGDLYDLETALAGFAALFHRRTGQPTGSGAFQQAEPFDPEQVFGSAALLEGVVALSDTSPPWALRWLKASLEVPTGVPSPMASGACCGSSTPIPAAARS